MWTDKENGYNGPGAIGYGVRMLVNWGLGSRDFRFEIWDFRLKFNWGLGSKNLRFEIEI
jgi:hypothetical protein